MKQDYQKILIIQTAFIGDVILATSLIEKLHSAFPHAKIDFLLRKGNQGLLANHPKLNKVLVWNKKEKYKSLFKLLREIRKEHYDLVINAQRFFSSGILSGFSGGKMIIGFEKNPLSFLYHKRLPHRFGDNDHFIHEVDRNHSLIKEITDQIPVTPKLYPEEINIKTYKKVGKYICMAPTSVWFTKQWPGEKWKLLINRISEEFTIYLLGGKNDTDACEQIKEKSTHPKVVNLAGHLSLLDSAALMKHAEMNYANDSAPIHLASAVDAPIIAIFCSTIPQFGFTPLSSNARVVETDMILDCRPCGLHGYKACPEEHFKCAEIEIETLL